MMHHLGKDISYLKGPSMPCQAVIKYQPFYLKLRIKIKNSYGMNIWEKELLLSEAFASHTMPMNH